MLNATLSDSSLLKYVNTCDPTFYKLFRTTSGDSTESLMGVCLFGGSACAAVIFMCYFLIFLIILNHWDGKKPFALKESKNRNNAKEDKKSKGLAERRNS